MSSIIFLLLSLQVLKVLGSVKEPKFPINCGWTPQLRPVETDATIIPPVEYSWLATLQYGNEDSYGVCSGSVINSRYVLAAAQCVTGERVQKLGGLTGVRLGNFTGRPFCDYGAPNCNHYLHFGVEERTVHENYTRDSNNTLHNDIALLRLNETILFDKLLNPVCLPKLYVREPDNYQFLTVSGWGEAKNKSIAKRAFKVPLLADSELCEFQDESRICAGMPPPYVNSERTSCKGDTGGPLMLQWGRRKMIIEGIESFVTGDNCLNPFFPTHYTRIRYYLRWIKKHTHR